MLFSHFTIFVTKRCQRMKMKEGEVKVHNKTVDMHFRIEGDEPHPLPLSRRQA